MSERRIDPTLAHQLEALYHQESRRVYATLVRLLGDMDLAEDAMQEAFKAAFQQWSQSGIPNNPRAWLVSAGRFKGIDQLRRDSRFEAARPLLLSQVESEEFEDFELDDDIEDDRLKLIFTCCHPAIAPEIQVALTLREVCGLSTEAIAKAFLIATPTMAQRIVRGKAKIKKAGIPYHVPQKSELNERLESVLSVIYLVFNEGYFSSSPSHALTHPNFSHEAIRLARLLLDLIPDAEVMGLLALMLIQESRKAARLDEAENIVLLEDQDRSQWNMSLVKEGQELLHTAFATGEIGAYCLEAAIANVHAEAPTFEQTNWAQLVSLYDLLLKSSPSPVVELNRAVALGMQSPNDEEQQRHYQQQSLTLINALILGPLKQYALAYAAQADILRRLNRKDESLIAYRKALSLTEQSTQRRFLSKRIKELEKQQ